MISLNLQIYITCALIGVACAIVGVFAHYRGKTLLSDAAAHATLPGIAIGFLCALAMGFNGGKFMPFLLIGAAVTAYLAGKCVDFIESRSMLGRDTAIAAVLAGSYGLGIVLLSYIQRLDGAAQAGLETILLGHITGIISVDALVLSVSALILIIAVFWLSPKFTHICFDETHAQSLGINVSRYDTLLTILIVSVLCVGLHALGVVLVIALLIIPVITARLWFENLRYLIPLSAIIGAGSCFSGAYLSSHVDHLPSGGTVVLCASLIFLLSLLSSVLRRFIYLGKWVV